jgi:multiple sugar transport system substrate-binding protein
MSVSISILAVGDPAVYAYVDQSLAILDGWKRLSDIELRFNIIPWKDYVATLYKQFEKAQADYNIVMLPGHLWLPEFVDCGRLEPIGDLFEVDDDFHSSVRLEMEHQEELYLVPSFTDGHLFFIRTDLAAQVGIDMPQRVAHVRDLGGFAKRVHSTRAHGIALKAGPSEIFLDWLLYLWDFGGEFIDFDGRPLFDSQEGVLALSCYLGMRDVAPADTGTYSNEDIAAALRKGSCVCATSWGGQAGFIFLNDLQKNGNGIQSSGSTDYRTDIIAGTFDRPWNVIWGFALIRGTSHRKEAVQVLKYLSSRDVDRKIGRYAGSPVRYSSYTADSSHCPWYEAQLAMLDRCNSLPRNSRMNEILPIITSQLVSAFNDETDPGSALRKAAGEIERLRGDNRR